MRPVGVTFTHKVKGTRRERQAHPDIEPFPGFSSCWTRGHEALGDWGLPPAPSASTSYMMAPTNQLLSQPVWGLTVRQEPRTGAIRASSGHPGDRQGATCPSRGGYTLGRRAAVITDFSSSSGWPLCARHCARRLLSSHFLTLATNAIQSALPAPFYG